VGLQNEKQLKNVVLAYGFRSSTVKKQKQKWAQAIPDKVVGESRNSSISQAGEELFREKATYPQVKRHKRAPCKPLKTVVMAEAKPKNAIMKLSSPFVRIPSIQPVGPSLQAPVAKPAENWAVEALGEGAPDPLANPASPMRP